MVSISCFYNHYNIFPFNFTFIEYEKYVKIIINERSIILTKEQLVLNTKLFQIFILSLLCTEDISTIQSQESIIFLNTTIYGINTKKKWKSLRFTNEYSFIELEKSYRKNPLNSREPKRNSSMKKIRKFNKLLNGRASIMIGDPNKLILDFYINESKELYEYFNKYIDYNLKFNVLLSITQNYGSDIMTIISSFI